MLFSFEKSKDDAILGPILDPFHHNLPAGRHNAGRHPTPAQAGFDSMGSAAGFWLRSSLPQTA